MILKKRLIGIFGIVLLFSGVVVPLGIAPKEAWYYTSLPGLILLLVSSFIKK